MRPLIAALALAGISAGAWLSPPTNTAGCTREVVQYTVFLPYAVQMRLQDAGFPITPTAIPYKRLKGRAWVCNGTTYLPRLAAVAEHFRPDLDVVPDPVCADATLCPATELLPDGGLAPTVDDGGADPLTEVAFECACSTGATCLSISTDGGVNFTAPQGQTLNPGTFTGAGCRLKSCGTLAIPASYADGGRNYDTSWPAACPVP